MKKWIVNADDFGYSRAVNYGILDAFRYGIVTSTTLMVNMHGSEHAAQIAKENKDLGVGIHLVLTCGKPVRNDVPTLIDGNGNFLKLAEIELVSKIEEIERELSSQLERFFSLGLTPTHIDSHHHVHTHPKIYPIVNKLAFQYNLPIRNVESGDKRLHQVDYLCTDFYGNQLTVENTLVLFDTLLNYQSVEIMCHPAFLDLKIINGSSYHMERLDELTILKDSSITSYIKEKGIQLVNYKTII